MSMPDPVVDKGSFLGELAPSIPAPILNFDGIPFPGVSCNCAPPDTNGEVGATQYVQMVNEGYQVFDKATGDSVLGPNSISSVWSGFGGVCETGGSVIRSFCMINLADRWVISQFAARPGHSDHRRVHCGLHDERRHRHLFPVWLQFVSGRRRSSLRLPAPRGVAGRLLHEHERVQLLRHRLPRASSLRL